MRQLLDLNKGSDTGNDSEGENNNFGSIINPEHFSTELLAVLHNEEDDNDDDSTNKTKETEEETFK